MLPFRTLADCDWARTIRQIHAAQPQLVVVVTGGGSAAVSRLLEVPGASRSLLDARVPYSAAALGEWLGKPPEQSCSRPTALAMASVAEHRSRSLSGNSQIIDAAGVGQRWLGVACTAALVSDRPKRGEHRCHIAVHSDVATSWLTVRLSKGMRSRGEEEKLVSDLILGLLAHELWLEAPLLELHPSEDQVEHQRVAGDPLLRSVFQGERGIVWRQPDGRFTVDSEGDVRGILPGSFNPLHAGHVELQRAAMLRLGGEVAYEIAIRNADKPGLDYLTLDERCRQFADCRVAITNTPLFHEKVRHLPGMVFVVGVDTAERIINPRYYRGGLEGVRNSLSQIEGQGGRFLVAGRATAGEYRAVSSIDIPEPFEGLFMALSAAEFRRDISSTELRRRSAEGE